MVVAVLAGCASDHVASGGTSQSTAVPPASTSPSNTGTSPCDAFEQTYIGSGLSARLPSPVTKTTYASTADAGPIQSSAGVEFIIDGAPVAIGRTLGTDDSAEPNFDKRVNDGVVLWVKATDARLRACILPSVAYDRTRDQQDPG